MRLPIPITFHGMTPSDWMEADIQKRAAKLDTYCRDIVLCRVTVDLPHRRHRDGNRLSVRIDLTVPGEEIAVTRDAHLDDVRLVVKESFDVARRRLQDYARRRRLDVKRHVRRPAREARSAPPPDAY